MIRRCSVFRTGVARLPAALGLAVVVGAGCAVAPPPSLPAPTYPEKIGWILRLEDERRLYEPLPEPQVDGQPSQAPAGVRADLRELVRDSEARVRVTAARAVGRIGLADGVPLLIDRLTGDSEPAVRRMAAFGLGLLEDPQAVPVLLGALDDPGPLVWGRAAEALARLGADDAVGPIGRRVEECLRDGRLAGLDPDEMRYPLDPDIEACRLGLAALASLNAYDQVAAAVLDAAGQPRVRWWPVAYALWRTGDPRAGDALLSLAQGPGTFTAAFAAQGLGEIGHAGSIETLVALADQRRSGVRVAVAAVRALGQIGADETAPVLLGLLRAPDTDPALRVEVMHALGALGTPAVIDDLLDLLTYPAPPVRAAALAVLAELDADTFVTVLSGLDADPHWSVRRALASTLGGLDRDVAVPRLMQMVHDADLRVRPAVLEALARVGAPEVTAVLLESLKSDDVIVRATAARQLARTNGGDAVPALVAAWQAAASDASYLARAAALEGLAAFPDDPRALDTLHAGLEDADWAVRVRAAALLQEIDPEAAVADVIRPAPRTAPVTFDVAELLDPSVSTQAYLETSRGVVQVELAVLDAPMTVQNFVRLARQGFLDGLPVHRMVPNFVLHTGDPRGDGFGGPGYTIRDEISPRPFVRGTLGMALDWGDTGGSQFFITLGPQPHLDGRYTVFGHVTGGLDVIDQLREWDVVERVRIWDGVELTEQE